MPATSSLRPELALVAGPDYPIQALCLALLTTEQLAQAMRFGKPTSAFYACLRRLGIRPVPGRAGVYDPVHVRVRLDVAHAAETEAGPSAANTNASPAAAALARRRARRGQR